MNKWKMLMLSITTLLALTACTETLEEPPVVDESATEESTQETELIEISASELSEYDGQDGNPAYVAVDGVVYDVTENEAWAGGEHADDLTAGNDYTEEILSSPHGKSVLEDLPVVGNLVE